MRHAHSWRMCFAYFFNVLKCFIDLVRGTTEGSLKGLTWPIWTSCRNPRAERTPPTRPDRAEAPRGAEEALWCGIDAGKNKRGDDLFRGLYR